MELSAIILALQFIRNYSSPKLLNRVRIYTDSEYVCMGITQWISTWKKNNWKTANNKDVKNQDLWVILDNLLAQIQIPIEFQWIKGHANDKFNEYVDQAAKKASQIMNSIELEY